ncbi:MAG: hypothetical protein AB1810_15990 [Pseudomonadota bacterium]
MGLLIRYLMMLGWMALPAQAHALPTPDALVSVANVVPIITGAIATALGGVYLWVRRWLGPQAGGLIIGGVFGGFIVLVGLILLGAYAWYQDQRQERLDHLAMYLRCDIPAHEAFLEWNTNNVNAEEKWRAYGNFKQVRMEVLPYQLMAQPDGALISTYRRSIQYHSGFPAVEVGGQLRPFTYVRPTELTRRLREINTKDLYLDDFQMHFERTPDKFASDPAALEVFRKFENIYVVVDVQNEHRYVRERDEKLRPANAEQSLIDWPVRDEAWIIDDARARFPEMLTLLPDDEVAELLDNEEVMLIAPYNSFHRSQYTHDVEYMDVLLTGVDKSRVLNIDMGGEWTSVIVEQLATRLDGKPFMVIGLTKYDWVYDGLDVAFEMWERLGHDPERFKLLGFTARLPEAAAIRWDAQNSKGIVDALHYPFWKAVDILEDGLGIVTGFGILIVAMLLRLVFFPIGIFEARSRMMRARIKQAIASTPRPAWAGSSQAMMHHLGVRGGWELLGTAVMLALILPAYAILSKPPAEFSAAGFLWIDKLTQPDVALSLVVAAMVYLKMRLSGMTLKPLTALLITVAFAILLLYLPASLMLYVTGVLLVTTLQELLARRHANRRFARAVMRAA